MKPFLGIQIATGLVDYDVLCIWNTRHVKI